MLAKVHHQTYHKSMGSKPPLPDQGNRRLLFPLFLFAVLILAAAFYLFNSKKTLTPPIAKPPATLKSLTLTCPLPSSFCKNKDSYKAGSFSAMLKEGKPIRAPFDGIAKGFSSSRFLPNGKKETIQFLTILDQKQEYGATYFFKGEIFKQKAVKENEIIATASGEPMSALDGRVILA